MFKLFNRSKVLQSHFKASSLTAKEENTILRNEISLLKEENFNIQKTISCDLDIFNEQRRQIVALQSIVDNLRKQKVYAGQKFYDPKNHKAPTIYLCARWNEWYMIRQQNKVEPELMSQEQFNEAYGHYELMPRQNINRKLLS